MPFRILLADDHRVMRQGLKILLQELDGVEVVAEAGSGGEAVRLVERLKPDLVIMDVTMPQLNGLEATLRIRREHPGTRVLGLSMQTDRQFVLGMLKAGASGYLLKDCSFEEVSQAIAKVRGGGTYLAESLMDLVLGELHQPGGREEPLSARLSSREREILQLIAEARKSKEIAEHLHISLKTVYTHRRNIMEKLGARNLAELTRIAIRDGLTSLDRA